MSSVTIAKPQVEVDEAVKLLLDEQEEKCTIVHCHFYAASETMVRIWPSTYLIEDNGARRKMIKAFNISLMPQWTYHPEPTGVIRFTLVFEGLGKNCSTFELLEEIPEPFGFYTDVITRNSTDVYQVQVKSL